MLDDTRKSGGLNLLFLASPEYPTEWLQPLVAAFQPDINLEVFTWPRVIWPASAQLVSKNLRQRLSEQLQKCPSPRIVVGWSLGANLVMDYVCHKSLDVEGLCLIQPHAQFSRTCQTLSLTNTIFPFGKGPIHLHESYPQLMDSSRFRALQQVAAKIHYWPTLQALYCGQWLEKLPPIKKMAWLIGDDASQSSSLWPLVEKSLPYRKTQIFTDWSNLPMLDQREEFISTLKSMASSMYYWDWS